jgi:hypothetical protein
MHKCLRPDPRILWASWWAEVIGAMPTLLPRFGSVKDKLRKSFCYPVASTDHHRSNYGCRVRGCS